MRFFVVGDVSVDLIYFLERIPEPGEEVPAQRALMKPGGAGGTLAAHLASLGNKVYLASRVGDDPFRSVALSQLEKVKVDLKYLQTDTEQTTSSILILLTPGGERSMISAGGASRYLDAAEFKPRMLDSIDAVVFSAYAFVGGPQRQYAINVLDAARKRELPIFADLGTGAVRAAGKELLDILRGVPYLLMNQVELLALTGATSISYGVNALKTWGLETVVVKVGAMGSIVITPTRQELIEPYPLEEVVDTTGSGDAFTATFAHAILQGKDPFTAARLGNLAGSLAATAIGGQGRLITEEDLLQAR
ncbi:carbohydrate kinase family protein [Meiothermus taiwanensis]|uniref:Ribokinase n=2 Tax=Meiothermus taiwanensis TaxID=172827 RepID=A0ABN5LYB3_9DEIN|nr:carbohydrate kinase family protein [Meiothermus taiwanensis]AWR86988.1 ribokinase [Meiothermus taiwanensis WR-220]KIQ54959.1 sugar kinase [Meiothermus taiwanensis]KZK14674.1 sugar kinase [Meiothermus taiwanensis]RIH75857.1 putative sugar kinase YdjH [Meiothermus taiwanensis]